MGAGKKLLLEAADSVGLARREDRITELLAVALRWSPRLAIRIVDHATLGAAPNDGDQLRSAILADHYRVLTQQHHPARDEDAVFRTDLEIWSDDGRERVVCEHKVGAGPTAAQQAGYPGLGRCWRLLIAPTAREHHPSFALTTWSDIAADLRQRLDECAGDWRGGLAATASAEALVLAEIFHYLEREQGARVEREQMRLTMRDVAVLPDLHDAEIRTEQMLTDVANKLGLDPLRRWTEWDRRSDAAWHATAERVSEPALDALFGAEWYMFELLAVPDAPWVPGSGRRAPAIGFGLCVEPDGWPRPGVEGASLDEQLISEEFTFGLTDGGRRGRLYKTMYLDEIAELGTVEAQRRHVIGWATAIRGRLSNL